MKKICVLGLGYIGLPTALLLAKKHEVVGVDINEVVVNKLNDNKLPFDEPGLEDIFKKNGKNFLAKTEIVDADVFLIAVPTPLDSSKKIADLSFVKSASSMISKKLKPGNLVVLESTVPPGTSEKVVIPLLEKNGVSDYYYVFCPERAIPGKTVHEMINNDRIIGGRDKKSNDLGTKLYSSFVKGTIFSTDVRTAEFVKLMENTYRDVNIALANEFAQIAEESGINCWNAIGLANKHPRVNIHKPGPGVGGHCLAVDPWFLTENSKKSKMIALVRQINDSMPDHVIGLVNDLVKDIKKPNISVLGLAYKADVDDTRESPAFRFIKLGETHGYNMKIHDPYVKNSKYSIVDFDEAVSNSDCIVIITDHDVFKKMDAKKIAGKMRNKNIVDTRNMIDAEKWEKQGFKVKLLGSA